MEILDKSLFEKATEEEKILLDVKRGKFIYWESAFTRFKKNKLSLASIIIIIVISFLSVFVPIFSEYSYSQINVGFENNFPSLKHPFGTDILGRDLLVRSMIGVRISILIGIVSATLVVLIGVIYGSISGYFGGIVDNIMMRIVDVINSVPTLLVVILLSVILKAPMDKLLLTADKYRNLALLGPGIFSVFIVIGLLYWTNMARITRAQILYLKNQEFITAARVLGASNTRIIFKHLIPNAMGPIIVSSMLQIPNAIFVESFLSFLGLGVSSPIVSLGSLTSNAVSSVYSYPYQLFFPSFLISIIILCFNLLGDGIRDVLDPRMKNK